jgi:hypothetical protein
MTRKERRPAMRRLRRTIQRQDICWWTERFLKTCGIVAEKQADADEAGIAASPILLTMPEPPDASYPCAATS